MDFMAGALCGGSLTAIAFLVVIERVTAAVDRAVKRLDQVAEDRRNQETYDDSENWKLGRTDDDDE
jgi:hypothetical protein